MMDALSFRLGDIPRSAALIARAKGGLGRLGDVDFGQAWTDYGAVVDYGGTTFAEADYFMPYDEIDYTADGFSDWDPFYDFGGEVAPDVVSWPESEPVWSWSTPDFKPAPSGPGDPSLEVINPATGQGYGYDMYGRPIGDELIRGDGGTVTSEGVGSSWWDGGGLSLPSMDDLTRLLQVGGQIYTQVQQAEINEALAERGIVPRTTQYPQTLMPGVPRTSTGTAPMVWNPATNRYEPARTSAAASQIIPGVDNTILLAGAAGVAALLLMGKKRR